MHPPSPNPRTTSSPRASRTLRSLSTSSSASSPRPGSSTITARPSFPWVPHPHPSSLGSYHSSSSAPVAASWERDSSAMTMRREAAPTPSIAGGSTLVEEQTMKQWSFNAFEWQVRDVRALREYLDHWSAEQTSAVGSLSETDVPIDASQKIIPELLRECPIIGDGKFKLEVCASCTSSDQETVIDVVGSPGARLSIFVTSLMMDYASHTNTELCATMMAAVKVQGDLAGERGARADWVWEFWDQDWTFRKGSEFWECSLPSLSILLEHPRIAATNGFVMCIQIHTPVGPQVPQQPSIYYVPKDLLEGIESSLDNANTGDVQFVCLERLDPSSSPPGSLASNSRRSSSSSSSYHSSSRLIARKRVIYAHSDILRTRAGGEYFSTMFSSGFSENATPAPGERKMHTVVVEEADFNTIYWTLKWVYGSWLLFQEEDDPRIVFNAMGQGQSAKWLPSFYASSLKQGSSDQQVGEWDWQTLYRTDAPSEAGSLGQSLRSLALDDTTPEGTPRHTQTSSQDSGEPETPVRGPNTRSPTAPVPRTAVRTVSTTGTSVRRGVAKTSTTRPGASTRGAAAGGSGAGTFRTANTGFTAVPPHTPRYPHSHPHAHTHSHSHALAPRPQPDPHPHPTSPPPPASALAIYQIAHRYALPGLAQLALNHILGTITPQRAFALLLATRMWDELHALIADYIVDAWDEVARSEEFEGCCREVAAGEWGTDGGKTLAELFRRLQSPSSARYVNRA